MSHPPAWLNELVQQVTQRILPIDPQSPIGCHYCQYGDEWEVTVFVSRTEVFGGEFDGEAFSSRFHFDLMGMQSIFTELDAFSWQPLSIGADDDLGPHIAMEGVYAGERVWLRVTSEQPKSIESGRVANVVEMRFEDRW
ncbi:MAG: hypothetical protein R3C01_05255 [Planctomycetaceae bacterium]